MNNKNIKIFNSYLAGIYEGQGHIWIPKIKLKKRFNNKQNPLFYITFKFSFKFNSTKRYLLKVKFRFTFNIFI